MVAGGTAWCSMRQGGRPTRPTGSPGASQMCRQQARPQVQAVGSPSPGDHGPAKPPASSSLLAWGSPRRAGPRPRAAETSGTRGALSEGRPRSYALPGPELARAVACFRGLGSFS